MHKNDILVTTTALQGHRRLSEAELEKWEENRRLAVKCIQAMGFDPWSVVHPSTVLGLPDWWAPKESSRNIKKGTRLRVLQVRAVFRSAYPGSRDMTHMTLVETPDGKRWYVKRNKLQGTSILCNDKTVVV
jgi:hypothetical protein